MPKWLIQSIRGKLEDFYLGSCKELMALHKRLADHYPPWVWHYLTLSRWRSLKPLSYHLPNQQPLKRGCVLCARCRWFIEQSTLHHVKRGKELSAHQRDHTDSNLFDVNNHYGCPHHWHLSSNAFQMKGLTHKPSMLWPGEVDSAPRDPSKSMSKVGKTRMCTSWDPLAFTVDALVIPWTQFKLVYAFPLMKFQLWLLHKESGDSLCT